MLAEDEKEAGMAEHEADATKHALNASVKANQIAVCWKTLVPLT